MPRLSIVPTPIGNLEDLTFRALRVLREADTILAEDTRHTRKLLRHYSISTPLQSYHQFNKLKKLPTILEALQERNIALVSSAGMPAISDPGFELIAAAIEASIEIEVLPGPSAAITAVVGAAIPAPGFLFVGFLPRTSSDRRRRLETVASLPYSLVLYESPHRLKATLVDVLAILGDRGIVAARELTKIHEEYIRSTVSQLLAQLESAVPKGEFTLVIAAGEPPVREVDDEVVSELRALCLAGTEARAAVRTVSRKYGLPRNVVYRLWVDINNADRGA